ncbi:MAG TPA: cupredoxin domain-containing protein [Acidocella sp.]|nr:cupredoxin domain-containing protein [Acidocella sp.]
MLRALLTAAVLLAAPLAQAAGTTVAINDYTFTPGTVTVHPGDMVTWNNQDSTPHTATSLDGASFDSAAIVPGGKWSFTFKTPGTYKYHCAIHPDMQGEVDVQ